MEKSEITVEREEYNFYVSITQDDPVLTFARFHDRKRRRQEEVKAKYPGRFERNLIPPS